MGEYVAPFDGAAATYDADFTERLLGRWLREQVWQVLARDTGWQPGQHLLELGCGTGADACWLMGRGLTVTATDAAPAMLARTRRKAEAAGLSARLHLAPLDLNHLNESAPPVGAPFDGALANFGVLNCVAERGPLVRALAHWIRPGGRIVLVPMGPLCPWEIGWHLLHGQPRAAFRRFRAGASAHVGAGNTVRVWYPSPRRLRAEFAPAFKTLRSVGIGSLLPPSYLAPLVERWPRLFARLAALDQRWGNRVPWTWLNDHFLLVLERR